MVREINLLLITNKLMKISIVVPCYNMENFIEESLLSIINQNYLELIIVMGNLPIEL
jgi:GT2 family glycosyltransferase